MQLCERRTPATPCERTSLYPPRTAFYNFPLPSLAPLANLSPTNFALPPSSDLLPTPTAPRSSIHPRFCGLLHASVELQCSSSSRVVTPAAPPAASPPPAAAAALQGEQQWRGSAPLWPPSCRRAAAAAAAAAAPPLLAWARQHCRLPLRQCRRLPPGCGKHLPLRRTWLLRPAPEAAPQPPPAAGACAPAAPRLPRGRARARAAAQPRRRLLRRCRAPPLLAAGSGSARELWPVAAAEAGLGPLQAAGQTAASWQLAAQAAGKPACREGRVALPLPSLLLHTHTHIRTHT